MKWGFTGRPERFPRSHPGRKNLSTLTAVGCVVKEKNDQVMASCHEIADIPT
jgi:hypothetical protein